jgi:hypothetical protein
MNLTINHIPDNWRKDELSFLNWFAYHIKNKHYAITND